MLESLEGVIEKFRPGFEADGFEVSVGGLRPDGVVVVRVRHRPDACEECLIPDDMLAMMFVAEMQRVAPEVTAVELEHERLG